MTLSKALGPLQPPQVAKAGGSRNHGRSQRRAMTEGRGKVYPMTLGYSYVPDRDRGHLYLAPTAPHGRMAWPSNFYFPLTNQCCPPCCRSRRPGEWLELSCPRVHKVGGQEGERKQQHERIQGRSRNTTKSKSSSRPSREPLGRDRQPH